MKARKNKKHNTSVVYQISRVAKPFGVLRLYWLYSFRVVRIVLGYFLKDHRTMSRRERIANVKPLRLIASEVWSSWRKWREFPFSYFINFLWLKSAGQFSKIDDFVPLIRHEKERDLQVTLRSKEILSSKVFMSKLMSALDIPQATPVLYGEAGRLFSSDIEVLVNEQDLNDVLSKTRAMKLFLKYDVSYGGKDVHCFVKHNGHFRNQNGIVLDLDFLRSEVSAANFVCQEGLVQIPIMAAFNVDSVNTLRIMTRFRADTVDVVAALLRVGRQGSHVDNGTAGGLSCHVDLDNWTTSGTGVLWNSYPFEFYERHPDSGVKFDGVQLPFRDKTIDLVRRFAMMFPGCEIVGWDICLANDGPKIVEVNWNPDVELPQMSEKVGRGDIYFGEALSSNQ